MKHLISIITTVAIFCTSCQKNMIRGNGNNIIQTRTVANFSAIETNGDFKAHIVKGSVQQVEIRGYENLANITETFVSGNKLVVKFKNDYYSIRNNNIEVFITIPELSGLHINGSGNIDANGFNNGNMVNATINGSGNIYVYNSIYQNAIFNLNGSGDIKASGLIAQEAETIIHGSGNIETTCNNKLKARIYGSGNVKYWGSPTIIDVEVSGSGKVSKQ
jgi:hypothetical protein